MRFRKQHGDKAEEKAKEMGIALLCRTKRPRIKDRSQEKNEVSANGVVDLGDLGHGEKQETVFNTANDKSAAGISSAPTSSSPLHSKSKSLQSLFTASVVYKVEKNFS